MKKIMFAFCFVFGGLVAVNAQDTTSTSTPTQQQYPTTTTDPSSTMGDQDRERINSRDLPDAIKRSLEGTEYRGWLVSAAYRTSEQNSSDSTSMQSGSGMSDSTSYSGSGSQGTYGSQGSQGQTQGDTTSVSGQSGTIGSSGTGSMSGGEVFVVELKNGAQTKTVRFDKDGNLLDEQGQDDQK